jgi:lipoprotein-releasing system permease protein
MIIVLVAILNIVGSLTMIVIQKKRDIGILKTIGLTPIKIRQIFRLQGLLIGLIGCGIGGSLGLGLSWLQQQYGFIKLAGADSFIINAYPINIESGDVITVILSCLALCILASWFPATKAAKLSVTDALRYE